MLGRMIGCWITFSAALVACLPVAAADPPTTQRDPLPAGAVARLGDTRLRHAAPILCVTFSPDNRRIVTGGKDGSLKIWDAASGECLRTANLSSVPSAIQFTRDGRLAVAQGDSRIHFLHPDSLKEQLALQSEAGSNFALSPDGRLIAAVNATNVLIVTEVESGLPKLEITLDSPSSSQFAFLPDGKSIAVAGKKGLVTLYKLAGGKPILTFNHGGRIGGIALSSDGKRLATGGTEPAEMVKVWDINSIKSKTIPKPIAEIAGAGLPQGWLGTDRLAASNRNGAGIYDPGKKRWAGFVKGVTGPWSISSDGRTIASITPNSPRLRVWDVASGKQLHAENDIFADAALLAATPDGRSLLILSGDAAYQWKVGRREAMPAGTLPSKAIAAAVGGGRLAVATAEAVLVYDDFNPSQHLAAKPSRRLTELAARPRSTAVSPDGKMIAYSGEAARTVIADAATGKTIRVLPTPTIALALSFSPKSDRLAVVGRDGFVRLWPLDTGKAEGGDSDLWRARLQRAPQAAVAFSPDGKFVAVTSATMLIVLNAESGEHLYSLDRRDIDDGPFQQLAFTPDSRRLVSGSGGLTGAIQVFDMASRSLVQRYTTGFGGIQLLAIFPDGTRCATAGAEEVITVWDLAAGNGQSATKGGKTRKP
jgi:WD40 repeat protein